MFCLHQLLTKLTCMQRWVIDWSPVKISKTFDYLYPFVFLLLYPENNYLSSLPGICGEMVYLSKSHTER